MKYLVQILLFINFTFIGSSQNLITNPSFEDIDSCYGQPAGIGFDVFEWSGCTGWSCPTFGSSDLWCELPLVGNQTPPFLPGIGFQYAHSGENYGGFGTFSLTDQKYREYIQNQLIEPLLANRYYSFSAFISATEDSINYSSCFQAYFSTNQINSSNYHTLSFVPQWKNIATNFLKDTIDWQYVRGIFKAIGDENFATIGCFDDSTNVVMKDKNPFTTSDLYYFIDDIKLELAPIEIDFPNVFTPTNDGINDVYSPKVIGLPDYKVYIYNRWGNLMTTLEPNNSSWSGKNAKDGTYFYVLKSEEFKIFEQGFFQLIR